MTGAAIVRWEAEGTVVLAVHGAFDGASAWALRIEMEDSPAREFVVDLTHAEEACDFAAGVLASWARRYGRLKRVRFKPGGAEHARILVAHGLDVVDDDEAVPPPALVPLRSGSSPRGVSA
jgi:anti-anti-sigma regulatory factor